MLPPELLRGLPEWRALVIHGNLSPVVVRLRMAWRRLDYRHAHRVNGTPRPPTVTEVGRPEREWPEVDTAEALIPLPQTTLRGTPRSPAGSPMVPVTGRTAGSAPSRATAPAVGTPTDPGEAK